MKVFYDRSKAQDATLSCAGRELTLKRSVPFSADNYASLVICPLSIRQLFVDRQADLSRVCTASRQRIWSFKCRCYEMSFNKQFTSSEYHVSYPPQKQNKTLIYFTKGNLFVCLSVCLPAWLSVCMYVCMYVSMYVCY